MCALAIINGSDRRRVRRSHTPIARVRRCRPYPRERRKRDQQAFSPTGHSIICSDQVAIHVTKEEG
jgi:hypothetical protein